MHGGCRQSALLQHSFARRRVEPALFGQFHRNVVMLKIDDHFYPLVEFSDRVLLRGRLFFAPAFVRDDQSYYPIGSRQANANCCAPANAPG